MIDEIGDAGILLVFFVQCCGKDMSGTEREQGEIVMEDAEKSLPTAQQEVVSRSYSFCILNKCSKCSYCNSSSLCVPLFSGGSCKEKIWRNDAEETTTYF